MSLALFLFKHPDIASRQRWLLYCLALCISLMSALLAHRGWPENLNWLHYDQTQRFSYLPDSDALVIIEIDDKSLNALGRWPWPRKNHAALLTKLQKANTQAVVFDVLFPAADSRDAQSDALFANAIAEHGRVVLPLYFEALGPQGVVVESPPFQAFYSAAAAIGHIHYETDADGIVRAVNLKQGINSPHWPHLALAISELLTPQQLAQIPGTRAPEMETSNAAISIAKDHYNLLPMPGPDQGIRHFSYSDIIQGNVDLALLQNKLVLIGATATGLGDVLVTPLGSMHGVELNAWTFLALQNQSMIRPLDPIGLALISFCMVLILLLALGRLSPKLFLLFSALAIVSVAVMASLLMLYAQLWVPVAAAIIGIALFFPLWSWLRAESMLAYLREEITQLQDRAVPARQIPGQQEQVITYLSTLGLIESATLQATRDGQKALQALQADHNHDQPQAPFWQKQIARYNPSPTPLSQSNSQPAKGSDLITRTLEQLMAAREKDAKNRSLIEQSLSGLQDGVCIADLCGQITYTNAHFKQWFLEPEPSTETPTLLAVLDRLQQKSGKSWVQLLAGLYQNGQTIYAEAEYRKTYSSPHPEMKNLIDSLDTAQTQFLCQISLVKTTQSYRDTLVVAFTDITQLKAAERARAEALSFLSHDLRSPMVSVLAILARYQESNASLSETDQTHIAALVRKNLDYAEAFLQLSKAEALPETALVPCDLHAVLDSAQVHALALASPKSISVQTKRCAQDAWVSGDISLLERAVNNLVSNAIKYSPAGSEIELSLETTECHAVLRISDQGPGIPESDQAALFSRFAHRHDPQSHGIGLGLNFVATVANKHKGEVNVQSAEGKGARFAIMLPRLSEDDSAQLLSD